MELTAAERLILANQYEILGHLKSDNHLLQLSDNLKKGYETLYNQYLEVSPVFNEIDAEFIIQSLELYEVLQDSFKSLVNPVSLKASDVKFGGFDGNNESSYVRFVEALLKNGQFTHVDMVMNSHSSANSRQYDRMLRKWNTLRNKSNLSEQEIQDILDC